MERLFIKNWREFQHYKDRDPKWIKLYRKYLDDFEFQCLPLASRALAPMLWLLASETQDGSIEHNPRKIAFRLRTSEDEVKEALTHLISASFIYVEQDASNTLAERQQSACLEREERRDREEREAPASASVRKPISELQSFSAAVCGNVGSTNRWTIEAVESQLQLEQSKSFTLEQAAERMITAANNYKSKTLDRSKEPTNWWEKFYSTGKWRDWLPEAQKPRRKTVEEEAREQLYGPVEVTK